jgi:hypothetical protein
LLFQVGKLALCVATVLAISRDRVDVIVWLALSIVGFVLAAGLSAGMLARMLRPRFREEIR